jgi:hypothetical protein
MIDEDRDQGEAAPEVNGVRFTHGPAPLDVGATAPGAFVQALTASAIILNRNETTLNLDQPEA